MKIKCFALVLLYQIFLSDADWDQRGALIMVTPTQDSAYMFPQTARYNRQGVTLYHPRNSPASYTTYSFCPLQSDANRFCNYGQSWNRNSQYDLRTLCPLSVEPKMVKLYGILPPDIYYNPQDDGGRRCADGMGGRYNFSYYLCSLDGSREEEIIYDTCYNEELMQIIYGYYTIESPRLLNSEALMEEQSAHFTYDHDGFGYDIFNSRFGTVVRRSYRNNAYYTQRPVAPPELLPFALQRKPLYHYMNLSPMHVNVVATWENFLNNLKQKLAVEPNQIHVMAGIMDLSHFRRENPQYLENIPIPDIFWVLIYNENRSRGTIAMIHNKTYSPNENRFYFNDIYCGYNVCNQSQLTEAIPMTEWTFLYCCSVNAFEGIYPFPQAQLFIFQNVFD